MNTNNTTSQEQTIINQERETVMAFKEKRKDLFTKNFSEKYIGVASDGIKTADDEVEGMLKLDLNDINVADEKVSFPTNDIAIMTYKMIVKGKLKEKDISGTIYCSTVFALQQNKWLSILHTESPGQ
jgi:hypothetical protein